MDGRRAPDALNSAEVQQIAPQILGFVDEKDAAVHPAMWDMLLSFGRAYPGAWAAINVRKVVLPRLMALLRCGCWDIVAVCQWAQSVWIIVPQLSSADFYPCSVKHVLPRPLS